MEQSRKIQIVAILALMIATMSLLVGFSSLNAQIEIAGNATIKSAEWDVHFGEVSNITSTNEAYASFSTTPAVDPNNSLAVSFEVLMSKPGNSISFDVSVVNNGTIDAKVSEISLTGINGYENYITWDVSGINKEDVIPAGETVENVTITLSYNSENVDTLNIPEISLSDLSVRISFIQAN